MIFVLLVAAAGELSAAAESWYVSNRLGMKLEEIPRYRAREFAYIVREAADGETTILTLWRTPVAGVASDAASGAASGAAASGSTGARDDGPPPGATEVTRWERTKAAGGTMEERVYEAGVLANTNRYGTGGRIGGQVVYAEGTVSEELSFRYSRGILRTVESRSPQGEVLWTVAYDVSATGALRATRRTGAAPESAAFGFAGSRLQEETLVSPDHTVVLRYDGSGRRVVWEVLKQDGGKDALLRGTYSEYDPGSGTLVREEDRGGAERTERRYDAKGSVVEETLTRDGKTVATLVHGYDAQGRRVSSERRSQDGREVTTYGYGADGKLAWEEYRDRGTLRRRIVHTGDTSRYEDIIQSERLALRITYEGDVKVREEVMRDGKVVRTRALGEDK
jgi:hypothetical protein